MSISPQNLIGAFVAALALSGCADLESKLAKSETPMDVARALAGKEHREAVPVGIIPGDGGLIATAHAHTNASGVIVYGTIKAGRSSGRVSSAWYHVDVRAVDSSGRLLEMKSTRFFPSPVPATVRGVVGHSSFEVYLPLSPPPGSKIQVELHHAQERGSHGATSTSLKS